MAGNSKITGRKACLDEDRLEGCERLAGAKVGFRVIFFEHPHGALKVALQADIDFLVGWYVLWIDNGAVDGF